MDTGTRTDTYPAPADTPLPTIGRPAEDADAALWPLNYFGTPAGPSTRLRPGVGAALHTLGANYGHGWAGFVTPGTEGTDTFAGYLAAFREGCDREAARWVVAPTGTKKPNAWRLAPSPVVLQGVGRDDRAAYLRTVDAELDGRTIGTTGTIGWAVARDGASLAVAAFMSPETAPGTPITIMVPAADGNGLVRYTLGVPVAVAVVSERGEVESLEVRPGLVAAVLDAWLDTVSQAMWAACNVPKVVARAKTERARHDALCAADAANANRDVDTPERAAVAQAEDASTFAWDASVAGAKPYRGGLVLRLVQPATLTHAYTGRVDRDGGSVALRIGSVTRNGGVVRVHLDALPVGNTIVLR